MVFFQNSEYNIEYKQLIYKTLPQNVYCVIITIFYIALIKVFLSLNRMPFPKKNLSFEKDYSQSTCWNTLT